jgi:DNA-binding NtrC family response regulator
MNILIVNTNRSSLSELKRALETEGHTVRAADSFETARALLDVDEWDALIANAELGEFHGLHLALKARYASPHVRAIVVGAGPDPVLEAEAAENDVAYVEWPGDDARLRQVLHMAPAPAAQMAGRRREP